MQTSALDMVVVEEAFQSLITLRKPYCAYRHWSWYNVIEKSVDDGFYLILGHHLEINFKERKRYDADSVDRCTGIPVLSTENSELRYREIHENGDHRIEKRKNCLFCEPHLPDSCSSAVRGFHSSPK